MTLAEVFRRHGPAYLANQVLSPARAKVWRAIVACRTAVLGGHVETCDCCGVTRHVYHSCRNRHCPQCQTRAKEDWLAKRRQELLPVPYFHLVFTLPHALHALIGQRPRVLYEMLFGAAAATLTEFAANPRWLGGTLAFSLILHTWKQDLGRHVHVHALVAGGALTPEGEWRSPTRGFLFPVRALSRVFRGKFIAALSEARGTGQRLAESLADEKLWQLLRQQLYAHDWVVYAKQPLGGPEQVLEYLGRYTHRVAISNERLVAMDETTVRFRVRATPGKRVLQLPAAGFIERFLLHVLPSGFKRIRHYGLLAPAAKATKLALARQALSVPAPDAVITATVEDFLQRVGRAEWARRRFRPCVRPCRRAPPFAGRHEHGCCWARRSPCAMAVRAARRCFVVCLPRAPFCRSFPRASSPVSFRSPVRERNGAARLPLVTPSGAYPWLDRRRGTLTIPISPAVEALQSNEVYLPRMHQQQGRTLSARQINAIR